MRIKPNPQDIQMMISKFLLNLPSYQLKQDRIWVHLQKMFHYFIDEVIDLEPLSDFQLQDKEMKQFFTLVVEKSPSFLKLQVNKIMRQINDGYSMTPIYGVVILNLDQTKILLVQSHKPAQLFGIPKGKINDGETPIQCACRQVRQQVGINVQLSEQHKIEIFYSKNCCFYLCKMQQSNINVLFNKNTQIQKNKGKKKTSKQIKSLVWLQLTNPLQLKLNVATKKVIEKLRSQKAMLKSSTNSNKLINNNPSLKKTNSSNSIEKVQKVRYRQTTSYSTQNIELADLLPLKCPFDNYHLKNRSVYQKLFETD